MPKQKALPVLHRRGFLFWPVARIKNDIIDA